MKELSRDDKINKVWKRMSADEQFNLNRLSLCGMLQNNQDGSLTILMGSEALDRYDNFIDEMYSKYS